MLINTSVVIRVNNTSNSASFVNGDVNDWATTILHELGHAYWDLYGAGTSKITPDGPRRAAGGKWHLRESEEYTEGERKLQALTISLVALVGIVAPDVCAQPPSEVLTVCGLIANRDRYNGKIVTVRGIIRGGHGSWLDAASDCSHPLVTVGVRWPNTVYLAFPDNNSRVESYHANFDVDWQSVKKAEKELERAGYDPRTDLYVETVTGLFLTYSDLERRVSPGVPGALRLGFGPLGEAPGQLLIRTVKDPVVVRSLNRIP